MDTRNASIAELREALAKVKGERLRTMIAALSSDPRIGVRKLAKQKQNQLDRKERDIKRSRRLMKYELNLAKQGFKFIAGVDEVGRGALAGPIVAGAVILKPKEIISGVNDSKKLTRTQREELSNEIKSKTVAWWIAEISHTKIDELGIQAANIMALNQAIGGLTPKPHFIICDFFKLEVEGIPAIGLVKGDSISLSVAAASIIAKVHRDQFMRDRHQLYPTYGFDENKGYGTTGHIKAIKEVGSCELHRNTFFPVSDVENNQAQLELLD